MRRDSKQFVRNMIIISVVGLIILMIVLFATLQTFLDQQGHETYIEKQIRKEMAVPIEFSEDKMVLVSEISEEQIVGYDIRDRRLFNKKILDTAKINDGYGRVIPITQIKKGDIIEVSYQEDKDSVVAVSKSIQVQSYKRISGMTVDETNKQINIGGVNYDYTDDTMVINSMGEMIDISQLGPFDVISIQELEGTVWSITVEEVAASIKMVNLPTQNGQIEIDNTRLIQLKDITGPIKLIPGSHKFIIKMEGYIATSRTLTVSSGETYEMSLADAEIAYTTIKPHISNKITNYTLTVGNKTYAPSDEIKVQQGEYVIEISAEGYEKWSRKVKLEKEMYTLSAHLIAIEEENIEIEN